MGTSAHCASLNNPLLGRPNYLECVWKSFCLSLLSATIARRCDHVCFMTLIFRDFIRLSKNAT